MRGGLEVAKRLVRHGNSRALVIDKAILELLKIDDQTDLELSTDGRSLVVTPIADAEARRDRLDSLSRRIMDENDDLFRRLAE
jgi:antitoxin component of MazEF toxin-antitoxin module